jgi:hypothetical protein
MAKYQDGHFLQIPRSLFIDERFIQLSDAGKWLFLVLKELEHRYTSNGENFFFRSNIDLAADCGWSLRKLNRIKQELIISGLIQTWQTHWQDPETGKKSEKHISAYRVNL